MKLYILVSVFIRIFDGYNPVSLAAVEYSPRSGGVHVCTTGGRGLDFGCYPHIGVFWEVLTYIFSMQLMIQEQRFQKIPPFCFKPSNQFPLQCFCMKNMLFVVPK